jgi:hypothetical protein
VRQILAARYTFVVKYEALHIVLPTFHHQRFQRRQRASDPAELMN